MALSSFTICQPVAHWKNVRFSKNTNKVCQRQWVQQNSKRVFVHAATAIPGYCLKGSAIDFASTVCRWAFRCNWQMSDNACRDWNLSPGFNSAAQSICFISFKATKETVCSLIFFFEFDKHFQPEQSAQNLLGAHASCWLVPLLQVVNLNLGEAEDTPKSKHSTDKKAKWLLRKLLKRVLTDENIEESRKNSARCIESCYWAYASFNKSSMLLADLTDAKENIEADGTLVIQAWCQNCCPSCRETW